MKTNGNDYITSESGSRFIFRRRSTLLVRELIFFRRKQKVEQQDSKINHFAHRLLHEVHSPTSHIMHDSHHKP